MTISPKFPERLSGEVQLPASKSICNRALAIHHLAGGGCTLHNLSDCDDTRVMRRALADLPHTIDIGAAGTAMRFLTALLAVEEGCEHILTGSARMKQRPIGILVDALRSIGAKIDYVENEGFPPLRIAGKALQGGEVQLSAGVSSQYISALLMIAPCLREGLHLHLEGEVISRPYIHMTITLMRRFGAQVEWVGSNDIGVKPCPYSLQGDYSVEADWSGASYWYEIVALSADPEARMVLPLLEENSLQGDSRIREFFKPLGVETRFENGAAVLTKATPTNGRLELDLKEQPDLAQTLVVTCCMLDRPFRFTGLQSLKIKETDRIAALMAELKKLGYVLAESGGHTLEWNGERCAPSGFSIATYDDHRMALAFAPCALRFPELQIENAEVVSKSYPGFWKDLREMINDNG